MRGDQERNEHEHAHEERSAWKTINVLSRETFRETNERR